MMKWQSYDHRRRVPHPPHGAPSHMGQPMNDARSAGPAAAVGHQNHHQRHQLGHPNNRISGEAPPTPPVYRSSHLPHHRYPPPPPPLPPPHHHHHHLPGPVHHYAPHMMDRYYQNPPPPPPPPPHVGEYQNALPRPPPPHHQPSSCYVRPLAPPPPPRRSSPPPYEHRVPRASPPSKIHPSPPQPRLSPDNAVPGAALMDPSRTGGCTCKKSRCLKLYCQCFASSTTCGPKCKCQACHNTTLHAEFIEEARRTILDRNPSAFDDKFRTVTAAHPLASNGSHDMNNPHVMGPVPPPGSPLPPSNSVPGESPETAWRRTLHLPTGSPPVTGTTAKLSPSRINKFGCKCRRSFCLKKYCECYQNSVHCGSNCRCTNCGNYPESPEGKEVSKTAVPQEMPSREEVHLQQLVPQEVSLHEKASGEALPREAVQREASSQKPAPQEAHSQGPVSQEALAEEAADSPTPLSSPESLSESVKASRRVSLEHDIQTEKPMDRMAIMAAVAMTELFGGTKRSSSSIEEANATEEHEAPALSSTPQGNSIDRRESLPPKKRPRLSVTTAAAAMATFSCPEDEEVGAVVSSSSSMDSSGAGSNASASTAMAHAHSYPHPHLPPPPPVPHHLHPHQHRHNSSGSPVPPMPYRYYYTASPTSYEDVIRSSGLPKSLSFRKICSKCGKTRGEHGELGFGNKCVYQDCGKCGAGVQMHLKAKCPMGILCTLTVEEGATPGAAAAYERKLRELAARATLQRDLQKRRQAAAERAIAAGAP